MENLFFSPWSERENNSCASPSPRAVADSTHMWRSLIFGTRISILLEVELVVNYRMRKFCHLYCLFNVSQAICKYHIKNQQCAKLTSATRRNNGFFFFETFIGLKIGWFIISVIDDKKSGDRKASSLIRAMLQNCIHYCFVCLNCGWIVQDFENILAIILRLW